jgi:hypothetical protein
MVNTIVVLLSGLLLISLSTRVTALSRDHGERSGMILAAILINLGLWMSIIAFVIAK